MFDFIHHPIEGIDYGIARNGNLRLSHIFSQQVLTAQGRRSKMPGGYATGELTVHLLRPRAVDIVGAQTGLDMPYRNLGIEGRQSCRRTGSSVSMHQYYVRTDFLQNLAQAKQHPRGDIIQVLPLLHDIKIVIGLNVKNMQYLIEHFTMLTGHTNQRPETVGSGLKRLDQRGHLDGLGTRSEYEHYGFHNGIC